MLKRLLLPFLLLAMAAAHGAAPNPPDAALEARTMALAGELRCLVCQNQSLADSHAPLAIDLRQQIREQLARGQSEQQVAQFMVQRYGDFVLYRPPLKGVTALLWFGPAVLLLAGVLALGRYWRRAPQVPAEAQP